MTLKTFNVADANLLSGSNELIRQALVTYYVDEGSGFGQVEEHLRNLEIVKVLSNFAETNASVDEFSLINSIKFATRLFGTNNEEIMRSDEQWKKYVAGGVFDSVSYPGIYDNNVHFDHRVEIQLPLYQYELNNSSDTISGYSRGEYYKFYDRYQDALAMVDSEHLIPNYYFLFSPYSNGADVQQLVSLEGNLETDAVDAIFSYTDNDKSLPRYQ